MRQGRFRFSLASLLIVSTAIVLFCGYSQWRRQRMTTACDVLRDAGYYVELPNDARDWLWQRKPTGYKTTVETFGLGWSGERVKNQAQLEAIASDLELDGSDFRGVVDFETQSKVAKP
jgi:hypothetical protein